MIKTRIALAAFAAALIVAPVAPLRASAYQSSAFLSGPGLTTIHFDEVSVAAGDSVTNQYQSLGATFTGWYQNTPGGPLGNIGVPNVDGYSLENFLPSQSHGPTQYIDFNSPVSDAVFALGTQPGHAVITSYLANVPVETVTVSTGLSNASDIYGFTNSLFDSISITPSTSDNAAVLDNLQFGNIVPEPSSIVALVGLCGIGLIGLVRYRRLPGCLIG
jgi:hypothetical protein